MIKVSYLIFSTANNSKRCDTDMVYVNNIITYYLYIFTKMYSIV